MNRWDNDSQRAASPRPPPNETTFQRQISDRLAAQERNNAIEWRNVREENAQLRTALTALQQRVDRQGAALNAILRALQEYAKPGP